MSCRQGAAKVYTVESGADTSTKKEQHEDQHILAILFVAQTTLHAIVKPSIEVIWETHPGYPAGQGVASPEEEKSHQCSGCLKFDCHTQLLQCSACQSVR